MKHLLAFGNSDQQSFRDPDVRVCFNFMTVPGTIAAYYEDATAAFVLSSGLDYLIDPRTPLFQGHIGAPRASHHSLASWMGSRIQSILAGGDSTAVTFEESDYSEDAVREMTIGVVGAQRTYGLKKDGVAAKMGRYRRLLAEALGEELQPGSDGRSPSFILAPYFVARGTSDAWHERNRWTWDVASSLDDPGSVSPVIASIGLEGVAAMLSEVPSGLSRSAFFWVSGFDERDQSVERLRALRHLIESHSGTWDLYSMYGGFYAFALTCVGLAGVNNGLGYSESRSWPELTSTGAAPPRYYVPGLHTYLTPGLAQLIMDASRSFWCSCVVCQDRVVADEISIIDLPYHDVKKHFALARGEEKRFVEGATRLEVAEHLDDQFEQFRTDVLPHLPVGTRGRIDVTHLSRWAAALRD
jgi:hypothetical protein